MNTECYKFYLLAPEGKEGPQFTHIIALYKTIEPVFSSNDQEMSGEII